jgi:hypothetical protein
MGLFSKDEWSTREISATELEPKMLLAPGRYQQEPLTNVHRKGEEVVEVVQEDRLITVLGAGSVDMWNLTPEDIVVIAQ